MEWNDLTDFLQTNPILRELAHDTVSRAKSLWRDLIPLLIPSDSMEAVFRVEQKLHSFLRHKNNMGHMVMSIDCSKANLHPCVISFVAGTAESMVSVFNVTSLIWDEVTKKNLPHHIVPLFCVSNTSQRNLSHDQALLLKGLDSMNRSCLESQHQYPQAKMNFISLTYSTNRNQNSIPGAQSVGASRIENKWPAGAEDDLPAMVGKKGWRLMCASSQRLTKEQSVQLVFANLRAMDVKQSKKSGREVTNTKLQKLTVRNFKRNATTSIALEILIQALEKGVDLLEQRLQAILSNLLEPSSSDSHRTVSLDVKDSLHSDLQFELYSLFNRCQMEAKGVSRESKKARQSLAGSSPCLGQGGAMTPGPGHGVEAGSEVLESRLSTSTLMAIDTDNSNSGKSSRSTRATSDTQSDPCCDSDEMLSECVRDGYLFFKRKSATGSLLGQKGSHPASEDSGDWTRGVLTMLCRLATGGNGSMKISILHLDLPEARGQEASDWVLWDSENMSGRKNGAVVSLVAPVSELQNRCEDSKCRETKSDLNGGCIHEDLVIGLHSVCRMIRNSNVKFCLLI